MLKKSITYEDLDGNSVTEDFYFNFSRLEIVEMDLKYDGGIEGHVERITESANAREAYYLFKDLVLDSYGVKSPDSKRFLKSPELRRDFESSPAMEELIFSFLEDASKGAEFVQGILPAKVVEAAKMQAEKEKANEIVELPQPAEKGTDEISDEELLKMNPKDMTQEQLLRAFQLKNQA